MHDFVERNEREKRYFANLKKSLFYAKAPTINNFQGLLLPFH